jgi:hypothetical protein
VFLFRNTRNAMVNTKNKEQWLLGLGVLLQKLVLI